MGDAGGGSPRQPPSDPANYRIIFRTEAATGETSYACRGSLAVRSIHGVWLRRTGSPGQVAETKLTKHPVSF
jgi:hypothetical protein